MSGSCAVSSTQGERGGGGGGVGATPPPPPQAAVVTVTAASPYDPSIEVNEWSGLLTYEQEVAVTPTFQDNIAAVYSPLIKGKGYIFTYALDSSIISSNISLYNK